MATHVNINVIQKEICDIIETFFFCLQWGYLKHNKFCFTMGLIKVKTVNKVVMIRQGWVRPRVKINRIATTDAGGGAQSDTRTLPYSILAVHLVSPRSSLTPPFGRRCRHPDRAHPSSDRGQSVGPVVSESSPTSKSDFHLRSDEMTNLYIL